MKLLNKKQLEEIEDLNLLKENYLYLLLHYRKAKKKSKEMQRIVGLLWEKNNKLSQQKMFEDDQPEQEGSISFGK